MTRDEPGGGAAADILVVDDNPNNLQVLTSMLSDLGYRCRVATSGRRALTATASQRPDLIMLDVMMPDLDGYETCARLKAEPATAAIPVIFITALTEPLDKVRAFEMGGADYVTKPFHIEEVVARIEHQLQIARLQREMAEKNRELVEINRELVETTRRLEVANRRLELLSTVDGLTGVSNRRAFDQVLELEWGRARRAGAPLSLLMIDIDCFKAYNDTLGHPEGDRCLKAVAEALQAGLRRPSDFLARFGGEEFVVLLPGLDLGEALTVAEHLRRSITALGLPHQASVVADTVSISLGAAAMSPTAADPPSGLVKLADDALYRAKESGRNRVWPMTEAGGRGW